MIDDILPVNKDVVGVVKQMCPLIQYNYEVQNLINNEPEVPVATQAMAVLLNSTVTESCNWVRVVYTSSLDNILV